MCVANGAKNEKQKLLQKFWLNVPVVLQREIQAQGTSMNENLLNKNITKNIH